MAAAEAQGRSEAEERVLRPSIFAKIRARLRAEFSPAQLMIEFPIDEVRKRSGALAKLPPGFSHVAPTEEAYLPGWTALLNEEGGFGHWTIERVRAEIIAKLVPNCAFMILHRDQPISCGCVIDASSRRRKIGLGTFLYVTPKYRGRTDIAFITTFGTLINCVDAGYERIIATTDQTRLSALTLYLSNGCRPVRNSIGSWWQWRKVMKRLGPTLAKLERRKQRRDVAARAA